MQEAATQASASNVAYVSYTVAQPGVRQLTRAQSLELKLQRAKAWLGDRYLLATPLPPLTPRPGERMVRR
jgi:hypothetical protein